jgi:hypothetical protein
VEGLERLNAQMQAVGISIANAVSDGSLILNFDTDPFHQEMCIRDLGIEFEKLQSAENVDAAQTATATSHKDYLDIKSVDVSVQRSLSKVLSLGRAQKGKLEREKAQKSYEIFKTYYRHGEQGK